jgi:hypothetical protein
MLEASGGAPWLDSSVPLVQSEPCEKEPELRVRTFDAKHESTALWVIDEPLLGAWAQTLVRAFVSRVRAALMATL